jgi:hypothetical protein
MARSLRLSAGVGALVVLSAFGPATAQQRGDEPLLIPFSSLSASAQAEILALQPDLNRGPLPSPLPLDFPVTQGVSSPINVETVMVDGRRVRINWAIGMYR